MEAALLMLDALAMAVLVFTSLRSDRLGPRGEPGGPFRFVVAGRKRPAGRTGGRDGRAAPRRTDQDRTGRGSAR